MGLALTGCAPGKVFFLRNVKINVIKHVKNAYIQPGCAEATAGVYFYRPRLKEK